MPDVLAIHPGGGSQVFVNPLTSNDSEVIITNNDGQPQSFTSPSSGSVILSPNPIVIGTDPTDITALQEQITQALQTIANQAALITTITDNVTILQAEQAEKIPVQRLEYTPSAPSSTWNITHNFGYIPSVELMINGEEAFTDIDVNSMTATLVFPSPQTGVAILT